MKRLLFVFMVLFALPVSGQINWLTMNEALEAQKKEPKKILIHFYVQWCSMCKKMDGHTYSNPEISKYINENYYPVKFDVEGGDRVEYQGKVYENPTYDPKREIKYGGNGSINNFAKLMNVRGYPTMVILDEKSLPITSFVGYYKPKDIEPYLVLMVKDDYQKITSKQLLEEYIENFNHQVKE